MVSGQGTRVGLLERDDELDLLSKLFGAARQGSGGAALIEGPAGIGKSVLLDAAARSAADAGLVVLRARGGQLEHGFGYGVVRQLLERHVLSLPADQRDAVLSGSAAVGAFALRIDSSEESVMFRDAPAIQHGLYWLIANLAESASLAVLVDDAHWADAASLQWLVYMARRLEDLNVALVVAARSDEPDEPAELALLSAERAVSSIRPRELPEETVWVLARRLLSEETERTFARACHEITGGNPFLLTELFEAVRSEGIAPVAGSVGRMATIGPGRLARNVLARASHAGREGAALAQAVAVLGQGAKLRHAADLAALPLERARDVIDDLVRASILDAGAELSFVHPLVRAAVYEDIPPAKRAGMHRQAATRLYGEGYPESAALHLLPAERRADPWVVDRLLEAAQHALGRGAPAEAATLLRRVLDEPPADELRSLALLMLGGAAAAAGRLDESVGHLEKAVTATRDENMRLQSHIVLASALTLAGRSLEAAQRLGEVLRSIRDVDAALLMRARVLHATVALGYGPLSAEGYRLLEELRSLNLDERTLEGRLAHAATAIDLVFRNRPASEAIEQARLAIGDGTFDFDEFLHLPAMITLLVTDRLDECMASLSAFAAQSRKRGLLSAWSLAASWLAYTAWRAGDLGRAEAEGYEVLEVAREHNLPPARFFTPIALAGVAVERGDPDLADSLLDEATEQGIGQAGWLDQVRIGRAQVMMARGQARAALDYLLEVAADQDPSLLSCPAILPWRSAAAVAAAHCGEVERARRLAAEEVELARVFGAPRTLGVALRAAGIAEGGEDGIGLLRESVAVLEESFDRLEHARALIDLGGALRRAGRRREAQGPLTSGLELATRCTSTVLAEQARLALQAIGVRPRRAQVSGVEALTASERRVAELAASGRSNAEVAQELFVSRRTVESHLQAAYRKLGVSSRQELGELLREHTVGVAH